MQFARHKRGFYLPSISALCLLAGGLAQGQTLNIVSGNGQLVGPSTPAPQDLVVQLLDSAGRPFPNQLITFTDTQNGNAGTVNGSAQPTDANGMTRVQFVGANSTSLITVPFVQTQIVASYGGVLATFTETTSAPGPAGNGLQTQINLVSPVQGQLIIGSAGGTGSIPIVIRVGSLTSNGGVPNIAVAISVDSGTATLGCKEGPVVYTDASGTATCTPVFGKIGTGTFSVIVGGGQFRSLQNQFQVTVGPPGMISVIGGDNQSGTPGQRLPLPIVATVSDLAGNILTNADVVFESVTPGGVTFLSPVTHTDDNGRVSTYVVLGNIQGQVQIRIRDVGNLITTPAIVTATVNVTITGLTIMSGNNQTTFINTAFGAPLVVRVSNSSGVGSGLVTFAVTSGSASLSPASVLANPDGTASTTVTAGPTAGPITVTATSGGFTQTFTLTANPPGPTNFSYSNGASFAPNFISPGSIVTINAQGLVGANVQGVVGGTLVGVLPYTVAGVSVTIDNIPAPIFNVSNLNGAQSVTVQIPFEVRVTTVPITISVVGGGATSAFVTVLPISPGIFETVAPDNTRRVVALRPNGTVVTPTNRAGRGENIRVYLTGLGPVSPSVPTGSFSPTGADPIANATVVAGINGNGIPVVQTVYARNLVGVYELTVMVPTDPVAFPSGTNSFLVAIFNSNGSYIYSQLSSISIQ